ncbi:MAG: phosphatase [Sphingomonas bacterium]|nr:phosphatase [Sphingomonas bacterium]
MTKASPKLAAAQLAVVEHRERTRQTLALLKNKVNPKRVARQALVEATVAGESVAIAGAKTVQRYPVTLAGLVAVAGLFLARHRIGELFHRSPDRIDPDRIDIEETDLHD